ncbi:MAG: hypothetical protein ACE5H9_17615 [Anaerolineae bacterium]
MFQKTKPLFKFGLVVGMLVSSAALVLAQGNANDPGILEPVLTALSGQEVRIPHTDQVKDGVQLNVVGEVVTQDADGATSTTGATISRVSSPNDDMQAALKDLADAAGNNDPAGMQAAAEELRSILLGTTQGRIYDGFAMLNYNRGAYVPDHVPGEYKMKELRDTGLTAPGIDGVPRKIWEVDVNMLWYDEQFDADTFLLRVPVEAHEFDTLRVNYRIYSLEREEFAPTTVMVDKRTSVNFPFKGFDSVWTPINGDTVTEISVDHPPLRQLRGVYTWGWRQHPPRIHFLQPVFEIVNAHTGQVELEPQGQSFAVRNRGLTIDDIGDAAPEKKMYNVAQAVLEGGASPQQVLAMLTDPNTAPRGTWPEWADLAKDQLQLPPEAWDILAAEGIQPGDFGPYRFVAVYLNQEMYGEGPNGNRIEAFAQGERFQVKVINLDNNTHYFRNVDFGPKLHNDIAGLGDAGSHSFEIMNFKPNYGAPKVAEMQWRAGWGFRPHFNVIQQQDVFPRAEDNVSLQTFFDGEGNPHTGYQYSAQARQGDFRFNPPEFIIGQSMANPSSQRLQEADGSDGLVIGQLTEGYGLAKMCSNSDVPMGQFCGEIDPTFNPHGALNFPPNAPTSLRFPPFLRNPNPNGGDIIPPTPVWKPFLWINPNNGTLYIDPNDPGQGYWSDLTYAHGAPIASGGSLNATIEAPRASGQAFYQFDDLFHDNAIFSPHPK